MKILKSFTLIICLYMISIFTNHVFGIEETDWTIIDQPYYYIINVNDKVRIESVMEDIALIAYDDYDGLITDKIKISNPNNQYVIKVYDLKIEDRQLGTYEVIFNVIDNSGNTASVAVYFVVIDNTAPLFLDTSIISYNINVDDINITEQEIISKLKIKDNHDAYKDLIIETISGSINEMTVDIDNPYYFTVRATDLSGNKNEQIITMNFYDDTSPIIEMDKNKIIKSYKDNSTTESILESLNIVVTDNYDDNLSYYVVSNDYENNKNVIDTYRIVIGAKDTSGNEVLETIEVVVEDKIPPVFYLDISKVYVANDIQLKINDFVQLLKASGQIKNQSYQEYIIDENYSKNYNIAGEYNYELRLVYNDGDYQDFSFKVNVIGKNESIVKEPFFAKIWNFIKKIAHIIGDIFKWLVDKIRQLF